MELSTSVYKAMAELEERNEAGALCIVTRTHGSTPRHASSKMVVYLDGSIVGTVGGGELENRVIKEAQQAILDGQPRYLEYNMTDPQRGDPGVCGGQVEVFVEPVQPKPTLLVIGAGHVGKAVARLAKWLGYYVVVSDDREAYCNPENVPGADAYYPVAMDELPEKVDFTPWTYAVLTTRGVNIDVPGLPALLEKPLAYIGVIGSKRRWTTTYKQLEQAGVSKKLLEKVHSPVGLELNAETPEEIAISIMAEIIMLRRGGDGSMMKNT